AVAGRRRGDRGERREDGPRRRRARGAEDVRVRRRARVADQRAGVSAPRGPSRACMRVRHAVSVRAGDGIPTACAPDPAGDRRDRKLLRKKAMARWEFKLPDIGEGITEGEIVQWLVRPGEAVTEDQPMVEVMTDKATVTITAPRAGTV